MRGLFASPLSACTARLAELEVLAIDCQATAAAPRGHLLEIGWARVTTNAVDSRTRLIALPNGERVPPAVTRVTGLTDDVLKEAVDPSTAWRELSHEAVRLRWQPAPTIIHFAQFERPFLTALAHGGTSLEIVCTHEIARRLLPHLPRRGVRALAGYFGRSVGTLRRSADHVEATAFVWRQLIPLLEERGVSTWSALQEWLDEKVERPRDRRLVWPMPRDIRLALPDAPGIYRLLRSNGDILYVGKAASLHHRVNSYFRKQHGIHERTLEMLSQARDVSYTLVETTLEAALLEPDEIKRHQPPYNVALTEDARDLLFASPDLRARSARPSPITPAGPLPSARLLEEFAALARGDRLALASGRWGPDAGTFDAGYAHLCATHPELTRSDLDPHQRVLRLGTRLWTEGRRDRDVEGDDDARRIASWTPELVQRSLEWVALRGALARRRAVWLTRLFECSVTWSEPGTSRARLLVFEHGEITIRADSHDRTPPVPPGYARTVMLRREAFTRASFDRLRVLTTELKRLAAADAPVALRLGMTPPLTGARLTAALSWV